MELALAAAAALGVAHIGARYAGWRFVAGVLKPLPILLFAATVAGAGRAHGATYQWLVVVALVFSMAGDAFLLFPDRFTAGLASFLIAHLVYIAAFTVGVGAVARGVLIPFAIAAALMLRRLWPHLGRERIPVIVYVAVIAAMGWRATVRALSPAVPAPSDTLALVGALSFMTSDSVLALNRFARPFAAADAVVMTTYYVAQALIALSAVW
jgi:uncharacterized membrane protein YhhN